MVTKRIEQQMLATVTIYRGQLGALDTTTGRVGGLTNATTIYSGKARIWTMSGSGVVTLGEGTVDTRSTIVSIPLSARPLPARDDLVLIGDDNLSDADLDTRALRVLDVDGGGLIGAARKLTCTGYYPSRYWGES